MKFIRRAKVFSDCWIQDEVYGRIPQEVSILRKLDHPNIVKVDINLRVTVKPVLSDHSKEDPTLIFETDNCLMQVKRIAESAILSTSIKLPPVFKTFVLSIFERPPKTGLTVFVQRICTCIVLNNHYIKIVAKVAFARLHIDSPSWKIIL